jgi:hypothetical protein
MNRKERTIIALMFSIGTNKIMKIKREKKNKYKYNEAFDILR